MQNILIADDNADITKVLAAYTSKEGYNPVIATDGEEALKLFDEVSPSAVKSVPSQMFLLSLLQPGVKALRK